MVTQPRKAVAKKAPVKKVAAAAKKASTRNTAKPAKPVLERDIVTEATKLLEAAGIDLNDVFVELFEQFEVDAEAMERIPIRPTLKNVQLLPHAVLMIEWDMEHSDKYSEPVDRDMMGFDNLDEAKSYYDKNLDWAKTDLKQRDNAYRTGHLMLFFQDSQDLMDFTYDVLVQAKNPAAEAWKDGLVKLLEDRKHEFVFSDKKLTISDVAKATPSAPKQVTGKRTPKVGNGNVVRSSKAPKKAAPKAADKKASIEDLNRRRAEHKAKQAASRQARMAAAAEQVKAAAAQAPTVRKRPVKKTPAAKKQAS